AARGNRAAGPYCIDPRTRPSSSRYTVPHDPHSSSARSIHLRLSGSRLPRLCHQTQFWQTTGAVSSVAPVRPANREVTGLPEPDSQADRNEPGDNRLEHWRDDGQSRRRRTSSVTSGRAKNRNGTNVVPSPGETCNFVRP